MGLISPTAQSVLDAANYIYDRAGTTGHGLAAALRAVADEVVPEATGFSYTKQDIRAALLAIADELEGAE